MSHIITIPNPESVPDPQPEETPPEHRSFRRWMQLQLKWPPGREVRLFLIIAAVLTISVCGVLTGYYIKLARLADQKLRKGVFAGTVNIFAAPRMLVVGDHLSQAEAIAWLRENGYNMSANSPLGWYDVRPNAIGVFPGRDASSAQEPGVIDFAGNRISRIVSLADNTPRQEYLFAPQLITNLSDHSREKRRLVRFPEIPPVLVDAVISTEDKHFFSHGGFDLFRILKAAYVDLKEGRKQQGASTLSMQLARSIWLEPDKKWRRKLAELLLTIHLEHKLTKEQIFTYYANQVYLGRRGTFSINGFGEAAQTYFGKDISQLTLPEAALLAGLVQRPSYYNPFRYPDRALDRRNVVLRLMRDNARLSEAQYRGAIATPLRLSPGDMESIGSQYFLDLTNDELQSRLGDREQQSDYVYTTLDEDLQKAAVEAVRTGLEEVDAQLRRRKHAAPIPPGQPQVALIALDPHTGEIKALVGGRDYGASQFDHVTAERQPGSSFKPFVYAAALNTAIEGGSQVLTAASTVDDDPTTFHFNNQEYTPGNFEQNFMGTVTLRQALAHSLNVATVNVAQAVSYPAVVEMARRAGLNENIKPTPAVALGSYVCTPLEITGAYTVFANNGTYVKPTMLESVRAADARTLYQRALESHQALDPRVNYLVVSLLEEVLNSGTGAGARSRGFRVPAAGKTGTSRDGWFAGFTSKLLCVVWVGFDDYRPLGLEGAKSALPIWTDFMKRALRFRAYHEANEFAVPPGVVSAKLCTDSRQLAGPDCPNTYTEFFIDGTQPAVACELHGGKESQRSNTSGGQSLFEPLPSLQLVPKLAN